MLLVIAFSIRREIDGFWPPSGHKEHPGFNDGVECSTRSAQSRVLDFAREDIFVTIRGGKTLFSLVVSIFWHHGFLPVPSRPPPGHEFPHFSNVPSVTAGGFFKARHRGNPHNVLPGMVQGRSHGGFLDMKESPPPSHPQPSSSSSGTAFGKAFLKAVTDEARNSSAAYPSPQGSFPLPN
ncbi:hypothetical protein TNCV_3607821 [Trichonephila clavipes]|nr:hypothetical protein TNCV_3607821 [Trichonephila clavipes]